MNTNQPNLISLLLVDDDQLILESFKHLLDNYGYQVTTATRGSEALDLLRHNYFDLVLVDQKLPEKRVQGINVLEKARAKFPQIGMILITAYGEVELVKKAFQMGAINFLQKPVTNDSLLSAIEKALNRTTLSRKARYWRQQAETNIHFPNIIGSSPAIRDVLDRLRRVISLDIPVLLRGESGTGKDLFARAIHDHSPRRNREFVVVNCTALANLQEAILFGYTKGAFTDAKENKAGLFKVAHEGTIFLDEVGDASLATQHKLLRVLQESKIRPLGAEREIKVNVRVISATSKDLEESIKTGQFEESLFFRLNRFEIVIPPLRERKEDIPLLVEYFLNKLRKELGKEVSEVSPEAMKILENYDYQRNNVRELERIISEAVVLSDESVIQADVLPRYLFPQNEHKLIDDWTNLPWAEAKRAFEKYYVHSVLQKNEGKILPAAKFSGMDRRNFKQKMAAHDIRVERK
jgi:DNA-binding NtrC family response regulator